MTGESDEAEERLVCPHGHMLEVDIGYNEGDDCPQFECPHELENIEISKERLELKETLHSMIFGCLEEDYAEGIEFTPYEAAYHANMALDRRGSIRGLCITDDDREALAETLEALNKLGHGTEITHKFAEDPWSVCLECGQACKNFKGLKIHKTKEHRRSRGFFH